MDTILNFLNTPFTINLWQCILLGLIVGVRSEMIVKNEQIRVVCDLVNSLVHKKLIIVKQNGEIHSYGNRN